MNYVVDASAAIKWYVPEIYEQERWSYNNDRFGICQRKN